MYNDGVEKTVESMLDKLNDVLSDKGSNVSIIGVSKDGVDYAAEIEFHSDLGEDVVETVYFDGSEADFISGLENSARDFDIDEHVELYVGYRGENGVPDVRISELIEDAQGIKDTLELTADVLGAYHKGYDLPKISETELQNALYELYKENWMYENVPAAERLDVMREYQIALLKGETDARNFEDYLWETDGFRGSLYVCKEEFLGAEYLDREFVQGLLNDGRSPIFDQEEIMSAYDIYTEDEREMENER